MVFRKGYLLCILASQTQPKLYCSPLWWNHVDSNLYLNLERWYASFCSVVDQTWEILPTGITTTDEMLCLSFPCLQIKHWFGEIKKSPWKDTWRVDVLTALAVIWSQQWQHFLQNTQGHIETIPPWQQCAHWCVQFHLTNLWGKREGPRVRDYLRIFQNYFFWKLHFWTKHMFNDLPSPGNRF